jgi:hypothetical protein
MCLSTREASCVLRALGSPQQRSPKSSPRAKSPPFLLEGVLVPSGIEAKGQSTESLLNLTNNHHRHHRHRVVVVIYTSLLVVSFEEMQIYKPTHGRRSIHPWSQSSFGPSSIHRRVPNNTVVRTTNDCCCVATGACPIGDQEARRSESSWSQEGNQVPRALTLSAQVSRDFTRSITQQAAAAHTALPLEVLAALDNRRLSSACSGHWRVFGLRDPIRAIILMVPLCSAALATAGSHRRGIQANPEGTRT